jgi:hypothetical protein
MIEVTCPSGLQGRLRGMKVKDEQLFADRKLVQSGRVISEILKACWLETLDPGPYAFQNATPVFENLLAADRTYLLIQLRVASYGPDYEFRVTCSSCRKIYGWGINLEKDIDVIPVSPRGLDSVKSGEPVLLELTDGRKIKCRLLTGEDERFLSTLGVKDESKALTFHLARRIVAIDGKDRFNDVVEVVQDMEAIVADKLWDETDTLEGGVETSFDVECPSCGNVQQALLPFEAGFFSSRKRFAHSKTSETG